MAPALNIQAIEDMVVAPLAMPAELISDGVLPEGTKLIIYGQPKTYKSLIAQQLAYCLSTGTDWLGFRTTQSKVLYVQGEIAKPQFQQRVFSMLANFPLMAPGTSPTPGIIQPRTLYFSSVFGMKLDTTQDQRQMDQDTGRILPKVLIIDPLYKFMSSRREESIQATTDLCDMLIGKYNLSVIIVAHARKQGTDYRGNPIDTGGGELAGPLLEAWADSLIRIKGDITTIYRDLHFELRHARRQLPPLKVYLDQQRTLFLPVP